MGKLTPEQFLRVAALEQHQLRLMQLRRMSAGQLHALLSGEPTEAVGWVVSAAESGVAAAQVRLGRMLLEGRGVPQDPAAALNWFLKAARQGDAEALNMAGRCHELGWGVAVNLSAAAAYYRRSAMAGHDWGQYNLGNMLLDGRGVAMDLGSAYAWFLRAAAQGHARAMNLLARCLEQGWGCQRSASEAAYWFARSADAGYFRGQFNHALELLQRGQLEAAASWLWKAAVGGDARMRGTIVRLLAHWNAVQLRDLRVRVLELMQPKHAVRKMRG